MYIRKTQSKVNGKTYTNYLLVESVSTPKGPRQKTIVSLGHLHPRSQEEWWELAKKVERALAPQQNLPPENDPEVSSIIDKIRDKQPTATPLSSPPKIIAVQPEKVEVEQAREGGTVHVGHQIFRRLDIHHILADLEFSEEEIKLTEAMVLNRLIEPSSENAMPDWMNRSAIPDLLGEDFQSMDSDRLYRHLDRLHPHQKAIEQALAKKEKSLFNLDDTILLYDLTSTYFEGQCLHNPQAKRGYSRDKRPDCKQVVIGLVLNRDGFPLAHEVFDGNRLDTTTVDEMLESLQNRQALPKGSLVVVDRGMSSAANLAAIRGKGLNYLVACRQAERNQYLEDFEDPAGWTTIKEDPKTKDPLVRVKPASTEGEMLILCHSEGRREKDRAIREKQEKRLLRDAEKLAKRIQEGKIKNRDKIYEQIGRIKERYPRVARYYIFNLDDEKTQLTCTEAGDARKLAEEIDGGYLLRTSRKDLSADEAWRVYMLLTRVEAAFRDMKSPLWERPIFHHKEHRVQTHIFLCVLAYHLLVGIEHILRGSGDHRSWETIREILRTHQVVTVVLPTTSGDILRIRKGTVPEPAHLEIYDKLKIPKDILEPRYCWDRQRPFSD